MSNKHLPQDISRFVVDTELGNLYARQAQSKVRVYTMRVPKFSEKGLKIYTVSRT